MLKGAVVKKSVSTSTRSDLIHYIVAISNVTGNGESGMKQTIVGPDGEPIASIDPMKLGIEDLIAMQEKTRGTGTGLEMTDLLTVIIFELNRTKRYALQLGKVVEMQAERIEELKSKLK